MKRKHIAYAILGILWVPLSLRYGAPAFLGCCAVFNTILFMRVLYARLGNWLETPLRRPGNLT